MRARRPAAQRTLALSIEPSNDEAPPAPPELPSKPPRPKSERGVRVACLRVPDLLLAAELRERGLQLEAARSLVRPE